MARCQIVSRSDFRVRLPNDETAVWEGSLRLDGIVASWSSLNFWRTDFLLKLLLKRARLIRIREDYIAVVTVPTPVPAGPDLAE